MLHSTRSTICYALRYAMPRQTLALSDVIECFWANAKGATIQDYEHLLKEVTSLRNLDFAHPCHKIALDDFEENIRQKIHTFQYAKPNLPSQT